MLVRFMEPRGSFRAGECCASLSERTVQELLNAAIVEVVVPSYQNPPGAPLVQFNGPVQFTQDEVAAACRRVGVSLALPAGSGLDGAKVLWALSGVETGFGLNCMPRHEKGYCTGKYSLHPTIVTLTKRWGHAAHSSFGVWQVMLGNLGPNASPESFDTAVGCAEIAVTHINANILRGCTAITLAQIADAYNSGNFRDAIVPEVYIAAVARNYLVPMPAPKMAPQ